MTARILYVCNQAAYFELHWLNRALAARNAGYDVTVAVPEPAPNAAAQGLRVVQFPLSRRGGWPRAEARSLRALRRLIRDLRPDLIHACTIKPNLYVGLVTLGAAAPAAVLSVTGLGTIFSRDEFRYRLLRRLVLAAYRFVARREQVVLTFENGDDRTLFRDAGVATADRLIVTPGSGVDTDVFQPTPEPEGPPVVILPARLLWDKGVGEFVEAARRLRAAGVTARLALVGDTDAGNVSAVPRATLDGWREEGVVEWWGFRRDMPAVFRESHVVCLPSAYREGIPRALSEGAASGRSLIATEIAGCRDIVRDGVNGILVPPRNVERLTDAIRRLVEDPALRARMGRAGRELAVAEFRDELVITRTLGAYAQLLGRAGA